MSLVNSLITHNRIWCHQVFSQNSGYPCWEPLLIGEPLLIASWPQKGASMKHDGWLTSTSREKNLLRGCILTVRVSGCQKCSLWEWATIWLWKVPFCGYDFVNASALTHQTHQWIHPPQCSGSGLPRVQHHQISVGQPANQHHKVKKLMVEKWPLPQWFRYEEFWHNTHRHTHSLSGVWENTACQHHSQFAQCAWFYVVTIWGSRRALHLPWHRIYTTIDIIHLKIWFESLGKTQSPNIANEITT